MRFALLTAVVGTCLAGAASAETLNGRYLEARNSNMWAGPCVFNAEIHLTGNIAVMAWQVGEGQYKDAALDGLSIVAVVQGDQTFGIGEKVNTQTVLIVDQRASESQRQALIEMARDLAGDTIQDVVSVKLAAIKMRVAQGDARGFSIVDAGIVQMRTRPMQKPDHTCGNERQAYPTLAKVTDEHAAYTLRNEYAGSALRVKALQSNNILSGVVANFSL
ncbi:MAG TPA: DUF1326 domain-containing protein [Pirellulaceae bacterium]|jgi:hypothetical protein|nr:DUF1326 domain-containing protein [Pirellulaceae bacterium]